MHENHNTCCLLVFCLSSLQIKPTKTTVPKEETKKQPHPVNLESSKSHQADDAGAHQKESPTTTESPAPAVTTKLPSASSAKPAAAGSASSQEHARAAAPSGQEPIPQRDMPAVVPASKVAPSSNGAHHKSSEKIAGAESAETEAKSDEELEAKARIEPVEQEPARQDQLNLEGFDFKDLEMDGNGVVKSDASAVQQTASATTPQQKESVFLRLSNRIKVSFFFLSCF